MLNLLSSMLCVLCLLVGFMVGSFVTAAFPHTPVTITGLYERYKGWQEVRLEKAYCEKHVCEKQP